MARKQLDDADENLISALAPLADRLPSQIPDAERAPQSAEQGRVVSPAVRPLESAPVAAAAAPAEVVEPPPASHTAMPASRQPLNTRVAKRSYTLPDYVETQLHETAYRTGLSKGAVILKALKADGFAIRDDDIRDRRKRLRPT